MADATPAHVNRFIQRSLILLGVVVFLSVIVDPLPSVPTIWLSYPLIFLAMWATEDFRWLSRYNSTVLATLTGAVHLPLILLLTPLEAGVIAMGASALSLWRRKRSFYRIAYNVVVRGVSVGIPALLLAAWRIHQSEFKGCHSFLGVMAKHPFTHVWSPANYLFGAELVLGSIIAALLYFGIDSIFMSTIVAIQTKMTPFSAWRANVESDTLPELTKCALGVIAACLFVTSPMFIVIVILPVMVAHLATQSIFRLERETIEAITTLAATIDLRDPYTARHSERVAAMSRLFATKLGLAKEEIDRIELAARVHDLGKMGTPNEILLKPSPLDADEMAVMKQHPVDGVEVLQKYSYFQHSLAIVLHHHERFDGKGYPHGLAGHDIPIGAHIVAHADAFDAMTSDRPYRKGMSPETALTRMNEARGTQFNPSMVDIFIAMLREELAISDEDSEITPDHLEISHKVVTIREHVRYSPRGQLHG